jgi:hypothetical protein
LAIDDYQSETLPPPLDQTEGVMLKVALGIGLLAIALYTGFASFPLWIVPALGLPFTAGYIHGKWYLWQPLFRRRDSKFYQSLVITYLTQNVVVFILYLLGSGIGRLVGS